MGGGSLSRPLDASLLRALRVVERADSHASRRMLFDRLAAWRRDVQLARWLTHGPLRGTWISTLLVAAFGAFSARSCWAAPRRHVWGLASHANDQRQIDYVASCIGTERVGSGWGNPIAALPLLRPRRVQRYARCVHHLSRRHGFLVACRLSSALACALAADRALARSGVRAVLVSSDYDAPAVGLTWAARRRSLATLYVSHAPPHALSPPLHFDLAILDGEAALAAYAAKGTVRAQCVFKGIEGETRPLDPEAPGRPHPTIGFFMPKEVLWPAFLRMLDEAGRLEPARMVVRWHPNMMEAPPRLADVESSPRGSSAADDARRCDWVVADENSSVQLAVLKAGVPVVPVRGLALVPPEDADLYGLVKDGVVPPPLDSLADLDATALAAFYAGGWRDRLARFDGGFGRTRSEVDAAVRDAVLRVIGG